MGVWGARTGWGGGGRKDKMEADPEGSHYREARGAQRGRVGGNQAQMKSEQVGGVGGGAGIRKRAHLLDRCPDSQKRLLAQLGGRLAQFLMGLQLCPKLLVGAEH